ncbi:hypothetical protein [Streptomyces sp. NPDC005438]|uniref:hypothetical protein n=1 Tax=Streptomyces sp. NPDC005438 TaxID=3156880 RepID=UPI0033AB0045
MTRTRTLAGLGALALGLTLAGVGTAQAQDEGRAGGTAIPRDFLGTWETPSGDDRVTVMDSETRHEATLIFKTVAGERCEARATGHSPDELTLELDESEWVSGKKNPLCPPAEDLRLVLDGVENESMDLVDPDGEVVAAYFSFQG